MIAKKIEHIGIVVRNLDEAIKMYCEVLGLRPDEIHREKTKSMDIGMIQVGESKIELLQPLSMENPMGQFLQSHGEGFHHVAVGVHDIKKELQTLEQKGIPLMHREPIVGVGGHKIAFLDPKASKTSLELVEMEH